MGDVHERRPHFLMEMLDLRPHGDAQGDVEVRQGLVHQEHRGLAHHRAAERDALALPARQLARPPAEQACDVELLCRILHSALNLSGGYPAHAQAERDVLVGRLVRVERVALEYHRDVTMVWWDAVDHLVVKPQLAFTRFLEAGDHVEGR